MHVMCLPALSFATQTFGEGINKVKVYHHYAYRVEAAPPFRVCGMSSEIQLVTRKRSADKQASGWTHQRIWKDTSQTAYISGLYLDGTTVHMSYGSSDIDARLLSMSVADMEALFAGSTWDCSGAQVLDSGSGEPLPEGLSASGNAEGQVQFSVSSRNGGFGGGVPRRTEYHRMHQRHRRSHHRDHKNMLR
jgi:hypothetical protein